MNDTHQFIKQADPGAAYNEYRLEIDNAVAKVLESGWYILGPEVELFESEFAAYIGVDHAVAVGTGTDAIFLSLQALGIGSGDEVITVSHTAVATVAAIRQAGAIPVFVDIDAVTYTMDVTCLPSVISPRTRAIVPVHLYGHPADMYGIMTFAEKHGLAVIEDCAQAHGAAIRSAASIKKVGGFGNAGAFSFYPTKNLGAMGDGGCVVTNDRSLAERLRLLRQYGWSQRYVSSIEGWNSRLDEMHAAVLRVLLHKLDGNNTRRCMVAGLYHPVLNNLPELTLPYSLAWAEHVYHQYVIRVPRRSDVITSLSHAGVGTAIHYPLPVHMQPAYRMYGGSSSLAVTNRVCDEILSLPMYPQLPLSSGEHVAICLLDTMMKLR